MQSPKKRRNMRIAAAWHCTHEQLLNKQRAISRSRATEPGAPVLVFRRIVSELPVAQEHNCQDHRQAKRSHRQYRLALLQETADGSVALQADCCFIGVACLTCFTCL